MGWDAYNTPHGYLTEYHHPVAERFRDAADVVLQRAGSVDWLLQHGGLDHSACARVLEAVAAPHERAAERVPSPCCEGNEWSPEIVQRINADEAAWRRAAKDENHDPSMFLSAREFIRACAEQGLGIMFC